MDVEIVPANGFSASALAETFTAGFEGYLTPVSMDADGMRAHVGHNDIDLSRSRVASDGGRPVGIALLGIRQRVGWVGGIGVAAGARGQGVGRAMMLALETAAREAGLRALTLEVITSNAPAVHLYRQLGYAIAGDLLIVERPPGPAPETGITVAPASADQALAQHDRFHPAPVAWQRQPPSLRAVARRLSARVALREDRVVAYCCGVLGPRGIHLLDVGVAAGDEAAMTGLIASLHHDFPQAAGRMVNIAPDDPAWPALEQLGYTEQMRQHAMILPLDQPTRR